MRLRRLALNLLLAVASLGVTLLLLELLLCKPLLPHLPKAAYHHMIRELRVLGQTSFIGAVPDPGYVAIAGDSNAQGKGDWFTEQGYDRTADYHSAHVLRDLLHKDVLSFGRSGAGSADGLLLEPVQIRAMLERYDMPLPAPSVVLAYFYEGNDIENNVDFLQRWIIPALPDAAEVELQHVRAALQDVATTQATGRPRQWNDVPVCINFLLRSLRNTLRNSFTRKYIDVEPVVPAGAVTVARLDGQDAPLPDRLQSPPVQLDDRDIRNGVLVLEASLELLARAFAPAPVVLVYIPAPLSCYELVSAQASTYYGGAAPYPSGEIAAASDSLFARVRNAAARQGIRVIDTRPALRQAARQAPIHGPRDWDHLNRRGYETLAKAIAGKLQRK